MSSPPNNYCTVAELLVNAGADPTIKNGNDHTAADVARICNNDKMLQTLNNLSIKGREPINPPSSTPSAVNSTSLAPPIRRVPTIDPTGPKR